MKRTAVSALFVFGLIGLSGSLASADERCDECPRVQLTRVGEQVRIAAQDDEDPYESLQHRARFVTADGASGWTDFSGINAYNLAHSIEGRVEVETIDLDGNVGRGVIIVVPIESGDPTGPRAAREESSSDYRWGGGEYDTSFGAEDVQEEPAPPAAEFLIEDEWDHTVCPVSVELEADDDDDDPACTTTPERASGSGLGVLLLMFAVLLLRRGAAGAPRKFDQV